jgi:WD40 repeat protein
MLNLRTGEPEDRLQLSKFPFNLWAGAVSDDLRTLVDPLPDGGIRVWDLQSGRSLEINSQDISRTESTMHSPEMRSPGFHRPWTAISPDGTALLTGIGNSSMLWWNLTDPSEAPLRLEGHGALFSGNGKTLVTLHDRSIKAWLPRLRQLQAELPVDTGSGFLAPVALADDGSTLAVGSDPLTDSENAIHFWDMANGKLLGVCKGHTQGVRWLAFSPDGETLASVSDDSTLRFWNVRSQQELLAIRRLREPIREILFSPDGNWLAAKTTGGLLLLEASRPR